MLNPLIAMPGTAELLVILAIVILVFGAAKLPELARGTGQALRIFKAETKGLRDDDDDDKDDKEPKDSKELPTSATEEMPVTPETPADKNNS